MSTATIVIVDDSAGDRLVIRRAIELTKRNITLVELTDGECLIKYAQRKPPYDDPETSPCPDLIFLDINMRKIDGLNALKSVRAEKHFATIPVVMLTTSSRDQDIIEAHSLGCTEFITKPENFKRFRQAIADACTLLDAREHALETYTLKASCMSD